MSIRERDLALISKTNGDKSDVRPLEGLQAAHAAMIAKLAQIKPKLIRGDADDLDLKERARHMEAVASAVDEYFLALGTDTKYHASGIDSAIDLDDFTGRVFAAIDGFSLYHITRAAERWAEDNGQFGVSA